MTLGWFRRPATCASVMKRSTALGFCVSVSGRIYPGSEIVIRDIREKIKNEYKGLTFYLENMMIKTTRYEEFDDEILRKGPPDAHKAD